MKPWIVSIVILLLVALGWRMHGRTAVDTPANHNHSAADAPEMITGAVAEGVAEPHGSSQKTQSMRSMLSTIIGQRAREAREAREECVAREEHEEPEVREEREACEERQVRATIERGYAGIGASTEERKLADAEYVAYDEAEKKYAIGAITNDDLLDAGYQEKYRLIEIFGEDRAKRFAEIQMEGVEELLPRLVVEDDIEHANKP